MKPSSQPPRKAQQPGSSPKPARTARRHLDHAPHRPERYSVAHRPRRVIPAHETSAPEYSADAQATPELDAPRPRTASKTAKTPLSKKLRRLHFGPWEWAGLAVSVLVCGLLLGEIASAQADFLRLRGQVGQKEIQLAALEKQKHEEGKKLAYLQSEKGREQILAQRGYLKPGDRIPLFPEDAPQDELLEDESTPAESTP